MDYVSIIIPCWNTERYVSQAIQSSLLQQYLSIEIIVVDDGSTDESLQRIRCFPDIKVVVQKNSGVSAARNAGLGEATGKFVIFLDADDMLYTDAVLKHLAAFAIEPSAAMVFGSCTYVDESGGFVEDRLVGSQEYDYWQVLDGITPTPSQCMFRRTSLVSIGAFNTSIRNGEDWNCYLELSRKGKVLSHANRVAFYRKHPGQATRSPSRSLTGMLTVVETHRLRYARTLEEQISFDKATKYWKRTIGRWIPSEAFRLCRKRRWKDASISASVFLRFLPYTAIDFGSYVTTLAKLRFRKAQGDKLLE